MPLYVYEALDSQGTSVSGQIEALNEKEAVSKIRNQGHFPTKVSTRKAKKKKVKAAVSGGAKRRGGTGRVKVKLVTQFARQLSTLQDAGLPILRSLRVLEEQQKKGTFKKVLGYVSDDIEGGSTLSESMARFPKTFDRLAVGMVAAGETGGVLDLILARIADFMEKSQKLKAKVKSAMVYPTVVLGAAFLILLGLMTFVVPKFNDVLNDMLEGEPMNKITTTVLGISSWIAYEWGWLYLIGAPFAISIILKFIRRFRMGRYVLDSINLRLPVIGPLGNKISVSRWTRTLGTLVAAGVPILDAIKTSSETAGNEVFTSMLGNVHDSIRQGETFADPLGKSKTVDLIVTNMVAVGEETGDLDKMLLKIADDYDEQVDVLVDSLMSMLEPIMIIVLGGVVMVIVLAIFLPMIQIIGGLSA
ncbi:MAG: type II secretion system F family protein [Phycisphaerae bacterium]|nr:type II secretion system F family protein [Phycisphaerae bacterium]